MLRQKLQNVRRIKIYTVHSFRGLSLTCDVSKTIKYICLNLASLHNIDLKAQEHIYNYRQDCMIHQSSIDYYFSFLRPN